MRGLSRAGSGEQSIVAAAADVHLKYKYHDIVSNVPPRAEHSSRSSRSSRKTRRQDWRWGGGAAVRCSEAKKGAKKFQDPQFFPRVLNPLNLSIARVRLSTTQDP